jgi:hypothetical protein
MAIAQESGIRNMHMRGHRLDSPNLKVRLARMSQAEMHLHFEGAFHWSTIWRLLPHGKELSECNPWLAPERAFADF